MTQWILKWPALDYPYLTIVDGGASYQWNQDQRLATRFTSVEAARKVRRRHCGKVQRKLVRIVRLKPTMARTLRAWDRQLEANNNAIAAITETLRALTQLVAVRLCSPHDPTGGTK